MPKLRRLAGRDVLTILLGFGFLQVSQRGSHVKLAREIAETRHVLTVPLHAELDPGTLRAIFRQARRFISEQAYARISTHKYIA
ncbi:MAG: type II toxin-antitoxin system HicA family toxin [Nitrospirota bacterium]